MVPSLIGQVVAQASTACRSGLVPQHGRIDVKSALVVGCLVCLGLLVSGPADATEVRKATTSRSAREEAIRSMPLSNLSPREQAAVKNVLENTSIYRRLPTQQVRCNPQLFSFLLRHPEVIVNLWEVMGVGFITLDPTGSDTYRCKDKQGTLCNLKVLESTAERQLIYGEGAYDGPLFRRPVRGKCLLLIRTHYQKDGAGRSFVTCSMDTFMHLDRSGIELVARTFQPLLGKVADYNFRETMVFVSSLSHTIDRNPNGVARISTRLDRVHPDVQNRFAEISLTSVGSEKLVR